MTQGMRGSGHLCRSGSFGALQLNGKAGLIASILTGRFSAGWTIRGAKFQKGIEFLPNPRTGGLKCPQNGPLTESKYYFTRKMGHSKTLLCPKVTARILLKGGFEVSCHL